MSTRAQIESIWVVWCPLTQPDSSAMSEGAPAAAQSQAAPSQAEPVPTTTAAPSFTQPAAPHVPATQPTPHTLAEADAQSVKRRLGDLSGPAGKKRKHGVGAISVLEYLQAECSLEKCSEGEVGQNGARGPSRPQSAPLMFLLFIKEKIHQPQWGAWSPMQLARGVEQLYTTVKDDTREGFEKVRMHSRALPGCARPCAPAPRFSPVAPAARTADITDVRSSVLPWSLRATSGSWRRSGRARARARARAPAGRAPTEARRGGRRSRGAYSTATRGRASRWRTPRHPPASWGGSSSSSGRRAFPAPPPPVPSQSPSASPPLVSRAL